jgi:eukaryotic-like serine/threonine-protein kinase
MAIATETPRLVGLSYKTLRPLGQGAGSTIFLIQEERTGRPFALKVVDRKDDPDQVYLNQARHEYQVARMLCHSSIVKIHDCRVKKTWYGATRGVELLMEFVNGPTLEDWKEPAFTDLVRTFLSVSDAMVHMHRRGVYHGDVKPSNVLISRSGQAKLIDFGTAWIKGQDKARVQGTPHYMAPEQAKNRVVDERTDLYNLGATMYRMFTGEYANMGIPGFDEIKVHRNRRKHPAEVNSEIPGALNETILSCLESSPEKRPAGIFEVRRQLEAVANDLGLETATTDRDA